MTSYDKNYDYVIKQCDKLGVDHSGLRHYHSEYSGNFNNVSAIKYERYLTLLIRSLLEIEDENISECSFGFDPTHLLVGIVKLRNTIYREHKKRLLGGD